MDAYIVRQSCRLLASAATNQAAISKSEGAAWALEHLDSDWHPVIVAADAAYASEAFDQELLKEQSLPFLEYTRRTLGWTPRLEVFGVSGMPEVGFGDDIARLICERVTLEQRDVVIVAQKIVSKAEGRVVAAGDPAIAGETVRVVAQRGDVVIAETRHGFVCANAGVDESNTHPGSAVLLPVDPDASAAAIQDQIYALTQVVVGVIVSDTFGRPWRNGQTNVAIGVAGLSPLRDLRGSRDRGGRELHSTIVAEADELAGAAELVMGKAEGVPVAIVRGLWTLGTPGKASDLVRPADEDLFPTGIGGKGIKA